MIQWSPDLTLNPQTLDNAIAPIEFKEALTRPLFRISRRPFDPAKIVAAEPVQQDVIVLQPSEQPAPPDASQLIVKGILINDRKQLALIATAEAPEGTWLAPGSEISGWTVAGMSPEGVILRAAASEVKLKLYVDNR